MGNLLNSSQSSNTEIRDDAYDCVRNVCTTAHSHAHFSMALLGLDNSGKSTLMQYMSSNSSKENVESGVITGYVYPTRSSRPRSSMIRSFVRGEAFEIFEVSGQAKDRKNRWWNFLEYNTFDALIYTIDISQDDYSRIYLSAQLLSNLLPYFENKPLLIFLTKCDDSEINGTTQKQIVENFDARLAAILAEHKGEHLACVVRCSVRDGTGVHMGMQWLCDAIRCIRQNRPSDVPFPFIESIDIDGASRDASTSVTEIGGGPGTMSSSRTKLTSFSSPGTSPTLSNNYPISSVSSPISYNQQQQYDTVDSASSST